MSLFTYQPEQFQTLASDVLLYARKKGATDTVVEISEGVGLSVAVRCGEIETIEQHKDKGIQVTVYIGQQKGHASTADFSSEAIKATVDAAYDIAQYTAIDNCAGLPDRDKLAEGKEDLALFHPWQITAQEAVEQAQACEAAAFSVDKRIVNSEGASVNVNHSHFMLANSLGFMGGYPLSRHALSVAPIAGVGQTMQRDHWYSTSRDPQKLAAPEAIGTYAAHRALSRLYARQLGTRKCPVLFEAPLAVGLVGALVQAVSGGALYRQASFLLDALGQTIFPSHIQLVEDPFIVGGLGSAPFDDEGVATTKRDVVKDGVLAGYFLSTYSARKLGLTTTANAGGSHNLLFTSKATQPEDDLVGMLKKMDTGLFVTDLMGQGVNYMTGDYSRGACGFWVEKGVIQFPVEEITIAGNLSDMFKHIVAVGADTLIRGTKQTGSILIESMTVAGN